MGEDGPPPADFGTPERQEEQRREWGERRRPGRVPHRGGPPAPNLDEAVLRPASRGHPNPAAPSKHASGVPKLLARKRHGNQVHDEGGLASALPPGQRRSGRAATKGEMSNRVVDDLRREAADAPVATPTGLQTLMTREREAGGPRAPVRERVAPAHDRRRSLRLLRGRRDDDGGGDDGDQKEEEQKIADDLQRMHFESAMVSHFNKSDNQDDDGYDSDADLEPVVRPGDPDSDYMDLDSHEHVRKTDKGDYAFQYDAMDLQAVNEMKKEGHQFEDKQDELDGNLEELGVDPVTKTFEWDYYFRDVTDVDNPYLIKPSKPDSNAILPLKPHGPELDDFLFATFDHPSKYAVIEKKVKHADSKREPRPTFPRDRKPPDEEFVKKYKGYLFVSGLVPHLESGTGEAEDFDVRSHKQSISEDVSKLFGVSSLDVWPASTTSAFVGFSTKLKAKKAMIDSANDDRLKVEHPVSIQKYESGQGKGDGKTEEENEFVEASPGGPSSIMKVTGVPANATSVELFQSMFPPGSKLEAIFGPLSKDDYFRASPTTALVNLTSADLVAKALKSKNIANNASAVGRRSVQVRRAKRERIFDGWQGVLQTYAASKLGPRLIVTGDLPPHDMYLSHHDMMHVSGLPPRVTLDQLAEFFQPFSADTRDVYGSGHIVRCSRGVPTGCAYIGFELPGEIEKVREAYGTGRATIGGAEVTFRTVWDKLLRRGVREGARPARSIEELRSDLNDWERHVDPEDIRELERLGIEKGVLDEIMMTLRHHNRTFAATDQAMSGERLYQERQVGTHYRDVVRKYLKFLKECAGTKEDPGLLYWGMFYPDQEMDTRIFDSEKERIKMLRKKGI